MVKTASYSHKIEISGRLLHGSPSHPTCLNPGVHTANTEAEIPVTYTLKLLTFYRHYPSKVRGRVGTHFFHHTPIVANILLNNSLDIHYNQISFENDEAKELT